MMPRGWGGGLGVCGGGGRGTGTGCFLLYASLIYGMCVGCHGLFAFPLGVIVRLWCMIVLLFLDVFCTRILHKCCLVIYKYCSKIVFENPYLLTYAHKEDSRCL